MDEMIVILVQVGAGRGGMYNVKVVTVDQEIFVVKKFLLMTFPDEN